MKKEYAENFMNEAKKRIPERMVNSMEEVERWVSDGARAGEGIIEFARLGNSEWQKGVESIKPPLVYGTVDGAGNVSELLMMQAMAIKLNVPLVLFLDDGAYNVQSSYERLTKPSLPLIGLSNEEASGYEIKKKFTQVMAGDVLPQKLRNELSERGVRVEEVSLAEAYRTGLYLLAVEFFGPKVLDSLSIVPVSEAMEKQVIGKISLEGLREKVKAVGRKLGGKNLVFVHTPDESKIRVNDVKFDGESVGDLYAQDGWLGGTAWVALTTMLLDEKYFPNGGSLLLAEKDTLNGANFATAYEVVGKDLPGEVMKVVVSGVRRIRVGNDQGGGDGVDPLVLLSYLSKSRYAASAKEVIMEKIDSAFPVNGTRSELVVDLQNEQQLRMKAQQMMKAELGIDGQWLMSQGLAGKEIGIAMNQLVDKYVAGELQNIEVAKLLISNQ